jgi:drug/metabolite transporter (DMT)-like permease
MRPISSLDRVRFSAADAMLITTVVFWALNFTVSKYILEHGFEPIQYSSTRYVIAAAIFAGITYVSERSFRVSRRDLGILLGCACLLFVNQIGFVYSLHFTTATTVALIFGTLPIFTGLIAAATGVEALTSRFALAAGVSFAGVALVATGDGGGLSSDVKGDLLALLGAATWAAYSVAIGPLMQRYSPYRISFVVLTATTVMLGLAGSHQLAGDWPGGWLVWLGFAFAVGGPLVLTNVLWFRAIHAVGPSRASLFANLQFFLAAIFAVLLLDESLSTVQIVGGLAIAAGILLAPRERVAVVGVGGD